MEVDHLVAFDYLPFGFVAKRDNLFVVDLADVESTESGNNHFFTFGKRCYHLAKERVDSFFDGFLGQMDFLGNDIYE